jgi:RNA polymerase-binding protein DksA
VARKVSRKTPAAAGKRTPKPAPRPAAKSASVIRSAKKNQEKPGAMKPTGRGMDRAVAPFAPKPIAPTIIQRPVTTDGKPRKNQAGLSSKELEHFRELLLTKRRELVGDMSSMEREALRSTTGSNLSSLPLHMADMGTDNYEQEFTLGLVEKDRQLLREINRSLAKIIDGSYGICEGTGKPITKARLEAQPWAKYSIEYARQMERGMLRR